MSWRATLAAELAIFRRTHARAISLREYRALLVRVREAK